MRLMNFIESELTVGKGLKPIEMKGLGQVVALFGPNGAGKTRLLGVLTNRVQTDTA